WRCADHLWGPAVAIANMAGTRTIFSAGSDRDVRPRAAAFRRPRWWLLYAWGLSCSDRIAVQHEGQLSQLTPRRRAKAYVVPSIVMATPAGRAHAERAPYVAWAGDLKEVKRPDLLIDIARRAADVRFVVCGDPRAAVGPQRYGDRIVTV